MTSESTGCVEVALDELGTSLCALRLCTPKALEAMQLSLSKLGQLTPVSVCRADTNERLEIFDGIKRWRAAVAQSWPTLRVEVHSLDMVGAKVRLLWCNAATGLTALEEAWVVRSLYRTSKVTQPEIALLLSRDKSWVCRRLMLAESLSDELMANVRLGLLSATAAVELSRLQRCNQDAAARAVMRRGLTTRQTSCLVERLMAAPQDEWPKLLEQATLPATPAEPKGGAPRRTPAEQLVADIFTTKRITTRLHARLLERSLESFGDSACVTFHRELAELRAALGALNETIDVRISAQGGGIDATAAA